MKNKKNIINRVGLIYLPSQMYMEDMRTVIELFKFLEFVPFHVEHAFHTMRFKHIGFSPKFDEQPEGSEAPEYEIIARVVGKGKKKTTTFEVKRKE